MNPAKTLLWETYELWDAVLYHIGDLYYKARPMAPRRTSGNKTRRAQSEAPGGKGFVKIERPQPSQPNDRDTRNETRDQKMPATRDVNRCHGAEWMNECTVSSARHANVDNLFGVVEAVNTKDVDRQSETSAPELSTVSVLPGGSWAGTEHASQADEGGSTCIFDLDGPHCLLVECIDRL
ncbi:hypothetical protein BD289DRAFT_456910 [Coniella lustricola]|uniref:Uncharacterized protein n=1 Tax=Coniella lustricola TaxID=2025994 RepID=A0A2T2ZTY6_9PEZI|nr:hypothetical protein BD289DRAFT_456910 [Coniella lustricola]